MENISIVYLGDMDEPQASCIMVYYKIYSFKCQLVHKFDIVENVISWFIELQQTYVHCELECTDYGYAYNDIEAES